MGHIESWKNSKTLISQSACDALENKEGKYSLEHIESYFTLFELLLAPKSNPLLAVEELHFAKQSDRSGLINHGNKIITVMYQYIQKEIYILSRPLKLQPMLPDSGTPPLQWLTIALLHHCSS